VVATLFSTGVWVQFNSVLIFFLMGDFRDDARETLPKQQVVAADKMAWYGVQKCYGGRGKNKKFTLCRVRKTLMKAWVIFKIQFYVKNKGKLQVLFARKYAFILAIV
jgi:hypothetical protein